MSYNILIVDDSAVIRTMVRRSIGMCGLEVGQFHEAGNGLEALDVLADQWIDIVFSDLNMPEMSGMELVRKMAQDKLMETIPVVIVSSERNQQKIDELNQHGIQAYITKPARPEEFRDAVEQILESRGS